MVTFSDIISIVKEAGIKPEIADNLKPDLPILSQGLDSVDYPFVAAIIEKKYNVNLIDENTAELKTINDFIDFINKKQ